MTIAVSGTEFDEVDAIDGLISTAAHAGLDAVETFQRRLTALQIGCLRNTRQSPAVVAIDRY